MKYLIILLLFASCQKPYTCICKFDNAGYLGNASQVTATNQKDADNECKKPEAIYEDLTCTATPN